MTILFSAVLKVVYKLNNKNNEKNNTTYFSASIIECYS